MQIGIERGFEGSDDILGRKLASVRELQPRTQFEGNTSAAFINVPTLSKLTFVFLRLAIHTNQHAASEITYAIRGFFFRHQRIQRLGICFEGYVKFSASSRLPAAGAQEGAEGDQNENREPYRDTHVPRYPDHPMTRCFHACSSVPSANWNKLTTSTRESSGTQSHGL